MGAREAAAQLRALCADAILSHWRAKRKEQAQAASDLLDEANTALEAVGGGGGAAAAQPQPQEGTPGGEGRGGPQGLPPERFFLPLEQVRQCLTLNIDASILGGGGGGGRKGKRKGEGAGGGGRRKARAFNPWTPELQGQLATVLRAALAADPEAAPPAEEVEALQPALAKLAGHLQASAAAEQLRAMGATLAGAAATLQVRRAEAGGCCCRCGQAAAAAAASAGAAAADSPLPSLLLGNRPAAAGCCPLQCPPTRARSWAALLSWRTC